MDYDCKREREMIMQGYTVIRFSGSEINADPDRCAKEIIEMIEVLNESRR